MGLDEKQTQRAGLAFDIYSSLISVEVTGGPERALQLATRCVQHLLRVHDSVLLLKNVCTFLLPSTPFSGAQALASRISLLLTDVPRALQVYHGASALMALQRLQEAGARSLSLADSAATADATLQADVQTGEPRQRPLSASKQPYLAFLMNYPPSGLLHLFPYELACRYHCVPIGAEDDMFTLATCDWLNHEIVTHLRSVTRWGIFQVRCDMLVIDEVLRYWRHLHDVPLNAHLDRERNTVCSSIG